MHKVLLLILFLISSCSLLQRGQKSEKLTTRPPTLGQWDLLSIKKSQSMPNNDTEKKDQLILRNGIVIENVAFNLSYVDILKNEPSKEEGTFAAFLLKGSPCHSCDNIESLYLVNPKRGGSKTIFIPGDYFAIDHSNQSKRLEFQGSVYYGACEQDDIHNLYLYKKTYEGVEADSFNESLFKVNPFMDNYPSVKLPMSKLSTIKQRYKNVGTNCFQVKKQQFVFP